jgi:predicted O-methyltransferase YrrM
VGWNSVPQMSWLAALTLFVAVSVDPAAVPRVRAASADVRALIEDSAARSATVRDLLARLGCSDVIVHVEITASPQIPRARTKLVAASAGVRFLRIGINRSMAGHELIGVLAHELQHAVEIAERDEVRDDEGVRRLYQEIGRPSGADAFETDAALDVERLARLECRRALEEQTLSTETWSAVDDYITSSLLPADAALDGAQEASRAAGLPPISVSAAQGKFLHLLARIQGARRILEVGTLGGYSTIWLARALPPGGQVVTLEFDPKHAGVARANIARAGLADAVDVRVGRAIDTLPTLAGGAPFDLIFIDADKPSTTDYFRWALKLSRKGSVIVVDNVVRGGKLVATGGDEDAEGMRTFMAALAAERRVSATAVQTVGIKGYDGFAIALVETPA